MPNDVPAPIATKSRQLVVGTLIELYILDASNIISKVSGQPGPVFAFHNCDQFGTTALVFQGVSYQPFPVKASNYEVNSQGKIPRPLLVVSNIGASAYTAGVFSSVLREFNDLIGAKLTRKRTLYEYLDDQPGADSLQEFPPEIFYVDRKVSETKRAVKMELTANWDVEGIMLPRRPLTANSCTNIYRSGDGCDYTGPPVTNQYGVLIGPTFTDASTTVASLELNSTAQAQFNAATDVGILVSGPGIPARTRIASVVSPTQAIMDTYATATAAGVSIILNRTRDRGLWAAATADYVAWDSVYTLVEGIRAYYVAKDVVPAGLYPRFNPDHWVGDICIKELNGGCRSHFGDNAVLPFMAFPALGRTPIDSGGD